MLPDSRGQQRANLLMHEPDESREDGDPGQVWLSSVPWVDMVGQTWVRNSWLA